VKLLLDTHIWLRAVMRPEALSRSVQRQLSRGNHELFLSPISIWEASQLAQRGRIRIKLAFPDWLAVALSQVPLHEAPLNFAVAAEVSRIHLPQGDLSDLFLAATASLFDLTLVTADAQLLKCTWLRTLAGR
jgi:PIN domain nuclease of toxin-antitoxin system